MAADKADDAAHVRDIVCIGRPLDAEQAQSAPAGFAANGFAVSRILPHRLGMIGFQPSLELGRRHVHQRMEGVQHISVGRSCHGGYTHAPVTWFILIAMRGARARRFVLTGRSNRMETASGRAILSGCTDTVGHAEIARQDDSFLSLGRVGRVVEVRSILASDRSWEVSWIERATNATGTSDPELYTGVFTLTTRAPRNADDIAANPLGLLISDFSWSRER
jgi:VirB8 protein